MNITNQQLKIRIALEKVYTTSNELKTALEKLSWLASETMGKELEAKLCVGNEIEFRLAGGSSVTYTTVNDLLAYAAKDIKCLTLEDLCNELIYLNKKGAMRKLRRYCYDNNIETLQDFIKINPEQFKQSNKIGSMTVLRITKALQNLGIDWGKKVLI